MVLVFVFSGMMICKRCRHIYYDDETTLLPGDFFLIPPHRPHAYYFNEEILYYNCQFYIDAIASEWVEDVQALCYDRLRNVNIPRNYSELNNLNRQGILHLNPEDTAVTASFFDRILDEQISTWLIFRVLLYNFIVIVQKISAGNKPH